MKTATKVIVFSAWCMSLTSGAYSDEAPRKTGDKTANLAIPAAGASMLSDENADTLYIIAIIKQMISLVDASIEANNLTAIKNCSELLKANLTMLEYLYNVRAKKYEDAGYRAIPGVRMEDGFAQIHKHIKLLKVYMDAEASGHEAAGNTSEFVKGSMREPLSELLTIAQLAYLQEVKLRESRRDSTNN